MTVVAASGYPDQDFLVFTQSGPVPVIRNALHNRMQKLHGAAAQLRATPIAAIVRA